MKKEIEILIKKAANAEKSEDAMRFSQAACNAANALLGLDAMTKKRGNNLTSE